LAEPKFLFLGGISLRILVTFILLLSVAALQACRPANAAAAANAAVVAAIAVAIAYNLYCCLQCRWFSGKVGDG